MKFFADFHVHSKYSRATAKNLDLENLYIAAQLKGITVLGTGDVTHPAWFSEIKEKLVPAETGLFKLREDIARACQEQIPQTCRSRTRFMLVSEISNIYKKNEKTRKNHNLVFFSSIETVEKFNQTLDKIGNIHSDGRPILGLDAKHLLEICLETSPDSFLVPAHIWTPWFSMLGSKSGFDTIQACFEELTPHIFAVETGLSSDPQMNWRVKNLDGLTLLSNSDAHSPMKLGREANIFDTDLNYQAIKSAIKTGDPDRFCGTIEFFPEEGKYHIDGHRKCDHRSWPMDTIQKNGTCPVCGKPMTLGVLYRVEQLADRPNGQRPEKHHPFQHAIPLQDILSELLGVGPNTKTVQRAYHELLRKQGSEFNILHRLPIERLQQTDIPLLGEAIERVREKKIHINPGYDGEFGTIQLFTSREREKLSAQKRLFEVPEPVSAKKKLLKNDSAIREKKPPKKKQPKAATVLNKKQQAVIHHPSGPLIIVAGPGTGKTLTITHRMAHLIKSRQIPPEHIIGLTFTNQAAGEMLSRLGRLLPKEKILPRVTTFHSFCLGLLENDRKPKPVTIIDDRERTELIKDAKAMVAASGMDVSMDAYQLTDAIIKKKQEIQAADDEAFKLSALEKDYLAAVYQSYQKLLHIQGMLDFEDLIGDVVRKIESDPQAKNLITRQYPFVFVDEYQDINTGQYRFLKAISGHRKDICVIGDPDQSIYGFRGSRVQYLHRFSDDYPGATRIRLSQNYRSTQTILDVSQQMIQQSPGRVTTSRLFSEIKGLQRVGILSCHTEKHEAVVIGKTIESLVGGMGFYSIDFGKTDTSGCQSERTFSDFAVLYRTARQMNVIRDMLSASGIPTQVAAKNTTVFCNGVRIVLSLLKILTGSGSFFDLYRILPYMQAGIGKKTFDTWKFWAYDHRLHLYKAFDNLTKYPIRGLKKERQIKLIDLTNLLTSMKRKVLQNTIIETIDMILAHTAIGIKEKDPVQWQEQVHALKQMAEPYGSDAASFFKKMTLQSDTDGYDSRVEKVTLMTMHASKGLEFPVVFISGCEDGLIPFKRDETEHTDEDEERRLFYVAMTRAREGLYFSWAKKRSVRGKIETRTVSPFVKDIEKQLEQMDHMQGNQRPQNQQTQLELF